ncbi:MULTISPECIES: SDR family NAD(P)-dependent oxidoreductase [Brevibacillus]|uniref:SDR family NAD(P)-dependent oxidoreductase n=1 Tax=Brevibacillus TaxID=55080 RepID=UPI0036254E29
MRIEANQRIPQQPLHTGYGPRTTAEDIMQGVDLAGKVAIVTGGYSGIGLEVSRVLAKAGAQVIVPARSLEKAKVAMEAVPEAELGELDLADPDSIDAFAHQFEESDRPLHILVNCAGIMAIPEQHDRRGYELQFATNHLGHFQLTSRLWPALKRANGARVVSVSSGGHRLGSIHFEDPNYLHRAYNKWEAYGQSKTANALFALELDKRGKPHHVRAFSVHPGTIVTELSRHLSNEELSASGVIDIQGRRAFSELTEERKTVPEGAATIVWCAVSNQLDGKGGVYCQNIDIAPLVPIDSGHSLQKSNLWAILLLHHLYNFGQQSCIFLFVLTQ